MNVSYNKITTLIIIILSMVCTCDVEAASSPSLAAADALYSEGKYREAAEAYLTIVKIDGSSANLYYDIANSYAQTGDLGNAILYYSRAQRLDPGNKKINNNLNFFLSKVEDSNRAELRGKKISVTPDHETFFQTCHRVIAADVRSNTWAILAAGCFILFLAGVAVYLFCTPIFIRKTGFFGSIIVFLLSIVFVVFAFMSANYHASHDRAVMMTYKTPLLLEPSSDSKPASPQLCQGTVFDIIAEESSIDGSPAWYKVRLNSDIEGWVRSSDVSPI